MFYYLMGPIVTYNVILIASAVIPAVILLIRVYRIDRLDKESFSLLGGLVVAGILSSLIALVEERVLSTLLYNYVDPYSPLYRILLYFVVVAVSEETSKYLRLKYKTWRSYEFNCFFDGVIYAVFVSLGFALWENINYVLSYGFSTALIRALTAIPGHACFGVFMGIFYAAAKFYERRNDAGSCSLCKIMALVAPILLHGAYDYIATMETEGFNCLFLVFVVIMFIISSKVVSNISRNDRYLD